METWVKYLLLIFLIIIFVVVIIIILFPLSSKKKKNKSSLYQVAPEGDNFDYSTKSDYPRRGEFKYVYDVNEPIDYDSD